MSSPGLRKLQDGTENTIRECACIYIMVKARNMKRERREEKVREVGEGGKERGGKIEIK